MRNDVGEVPEWWGGVIKLLYENEVRFLCEKTIEGRGWTPEIRNVVGEMSG